MIKKSVLLTGIFSLLFSYNSFATRYYNTQYGTVVNTGNGSSFLIPKQAQPTAAMKGQGVTFSNSVQISEEKGEDGKMVKKYKVWINGCKLVALPEKKEEQKTLKNGDNVEVKFDAPGSCNVQDWRKITY